MRTTLFCKRYFQYKANLWSSEDITPKSECGLPYVELN